MFEFLNSHDVGIDLGTSTVLVYVKGKGIVLREPSVVAIDKNTNKILQVGDEARRMIGRTPGNIVAIRPLKDGVISNFDVTEEMIRYFLRKVVGRRIFFKPRVIVCVPSGVTDVERRSVIEAANDAGARNTYIIEEPIAAAIGANIDIAAPYGTMIVDIGGGTTDVAVISLGNPVVTQSIKVAGDKFDEAIVKYMKEKHNLLIGERTAEEIKITIGSAFPRKENTYMDVTGRFIGGEMGNRNTGLPKTLNISSNETIVALDKPLQDILEVVHNVLERTPPELAADIAENGICMTGGGALLYGLDRLIAEHTKIPCYVAEDAVSCVALGTGKSLENLDAMSAYSPVRDYNRRSIF